MFSGTQNRSYEREVTYFIYPWAITSTLHAFCPSLTFCIAFLHSEDIFRADLVVHDTIIRYRPLLMPQFILETTLLHVVLMYLFVSEHKVTNITVYTEQKSTNPVYELSHLAALSLLSSCTQTPHYLMIYTRLPVGLVFLPSHLLVVSKGVSEQCRM